MVDKEILHYCIVAIDTLPAHDLSKAMNHQYFAILLALILQPQIGVQDGITLTLGRVLRAYPAMLSPLVDLDFRTQVTTLSLYSSTIVRRHSF